MTKPGPHVRFPMKTAAASAALAAALTTAAVLAAPASAASYNDVCGSGYGVVNSADLPGGAGTVFLTYNAANGRNCAVNVRADAGERLPMDVQLARSDDPDSAALDTGDFTEYAGPVYLEARGQCVTWSGITGTGQAGKAGTNCG
ncbi:spore-associated protein A [Nocardiopsis sediminis]|uniref:Spore-associated protein A n=1 Tax=Nocardiopsis sediminis TaxID=1778267 RepID=A0ABV8FMD6_9ACTN